MREKEFQYSSELLDYYRSGLEIDIEEILVNETNLASMNQMLQEENCYMKDFEEDEKGEICKVHYIRVTS
jgi:Zn/Cd-binding protein ZinT